MRPGDRVSFKNNSHVYHVDSTELIPACLPTCVMDHDHYEEEYVVVKQVIFWAFPLSSLKTIFDEKGIGRVFDRDKEL